MSVDLPRAAATARPVLLMLLCATVACAPGTEAPAGGTGGSAAGGTTASGGTTAAGGSLATGGSSGAGGSGAGGLAGQGGTSGSGGTPSSGGSSVPDANGPEDTSSPVDTSMPSASGSPGCANGKGLPEGDATIMVGGMNRRYRTRLPRNYSRDKAWPLVLALHPNGGAGIGFYDGGGRAVAPLLADKAVLILPEARPMGGGWDWRGDLPADLAYFESLLGRVKAELCIDETRIFSMGFSGGGSFSGVLGCMRKDIRGIAVAGAVTYFEENACVNTPAAWVAISEGDLAPNRTAFRDYFRGRAGCNTSTTAATPSGCSAYGACMAGKPVHYCAYPGGHAWPGFGNQGAIDFFDKL